MKDTIDEFILETTKAAEEQKEYFTGPLGTNLGKRDNATPLFD